MEGFDERFDVVVVGGGNAGFTAATTAAQAGARVCLVEKAPSEHAGGNTYFTEGRYRYCFGGLQDLLPFLYHSDGTKGLPQDLVEKIEIAPYTEAEFYDVSNAGGCCVKEHSPFNLQARLEFVCWLNSYRIFTMLSARHKRKPTRR